MASVHSLITVAISLQGLCSYPALVPMIKNAFKSVVLVIDPDNRQSGGLTITDENGDLTIVVNLKGVHGTGHVCVPKPSLQNEFILSPSRDALQVDGGWRITLERLWKLRDAKIQCEIDTRINTKRVNSALAGEKTRHHQTNNQPHYPHHVITHHTKNQHTTPSHHTITPYTISFITTDRHCTDVIGKQVAVNIDWKSVTSNPTFASTMTNYIEIMHAIAETVTEDNLAQYHGYDGGDDDGDAMCGVCV